MEGERDSVRKSENDRRRGRERGSRTADRDTERYTY